ncbi:MAG: lipid II flippase MurJ [Terracidiphilus sp.]
MSTATVSGREAGTNRRILNAAFAVIVATLAVKVVATAKEFTVAGIFGRSDALEAFLAAALIPGLLVNLIAESMNQALVPTLVRVRLAEGRERAQQLLSNTLVWTCILLVMVSLGMELSARLFFPLIGSHFTPGKLSLAVRLFYGLLPVVVLTGVASLCTSVVNTTGRFALPALAPVATPVAILVCVSLFAGRLGIWAMVYGTVAGALLQAIWVGWMMRSGEFRLSLRWYGMNTATRQVALQYGPVLLSGLVASGGLLVDQAMAATLPQGSVASLAYAGRFVGVPLALLGGAISSSLTPHFSEMIAHEDWYECGRSLRIWAWSSASLATLVAIALIAGAQTLVRLMFQHGVFGPQDTSAVSIVLIMYALQIPFFACSRVFYRFLVAMRRTDLVFYCGLLNLGLDVVLNLVLMRRFGVAGIALATSLWTMSTLIFLGYWSWKVLPKAEADIPDREG